MGLLEQLGYITPWKEEEEPPTMYYYDDDEVPACRNDAELLNRFRKSGLIILDPAKDPDPYGLHSISFVDRLKEMGWTELPVHINSRYVN